MLNLLELIQCVCEQQLAENQQLLLSLHNDTGYTAATYLGAEESLIDDLQALLRAAIINSSLRLNLRLSRSEDGVLISCCCDGTILPPVMLSPDIEWHLPLVKLPGRTLFASVESADENFHRYILCLATSFNLAINDGSTKTSHNEADLIIRDLRYTQENYADSDLPVINVYAASQATADHQQNTLWWPFFDSDFHTQINDFRRQQPLKVLVADDSKPSQVATQIMLERIGCRVVCADDGTKALGIAEQENFDLLFLDERMPGLLGSQVAKKLSDGDSFNCHASKVSLTGITESEKISELYQSGIQYYLRKPVTRLMLEEFLNDWLADNVSQETKTNNFK